MSGTDQIVVGFDEASGVILDFASARASVSGASHQVVGVTGPVGSGKTTLATSLTECVVHADDFLPDYREVSYEARDEPRHADLAGLASVLSSLRDGIATACPVWSHVTHRREGERIIAPAPVIVCEGIHALCDPVASVLDVRVFVEASESVRRARWTAIEEAGDRGWGVDAAMKFLGEVADPTFARHGGAARDTADVIVRNED